jgi:dipeptidyl-peptidase-4
MKILAALFVLLSLNLSAAELSIERLFDAPSLSGPTPQSLKISPDGKLVTFLRGKQTNQFQLDLWTRNIASGQEALLVDSATLVSGDGELSDEEKARRERLRIGQLSGIVAYDFSSDGRRLLFTLQGEVYVYDLENEKGVKRMTDSASQEIDPQLSPGGSYAAYVRDQNLYIRPLAGAEELPVSRDGKGAVAYGMAEFIAQEEMDRYTGYWFAPDDSRIAYTRVDESGVQVEERTEIYADGARSFKQRYPAAGTANAVVQLFVRDLASGEVREMDLGENKDIYLARVDWFPDNRHLAVQRQSRDQKTLELIKVDTLTGEGRVLITETSDAWVDLHNDLHFLQRQDAFIWNSARSGYDHLYLYSNDGKLIRQLTGGEWVVTADGRADSAIKAVDEENGVLYFTGTYTTPIERHLYRVGLDGSGADKPEQITTGSGWHSISMDKQGSAYLDSFTSPDRPPQVSLHTSDGERLAWIAENPLDKSHPYYEYLSGHGATEFGTLKAGDGQPMHYSLIKPADFDPGKRYPVVVMVYGGPASQRVTRTWSAGFEQWLSRQGYLVFALDNRGTPDRGAAFETPIYLKAATVEVDDQLAGVEFLTGLEFVDASRIGIYGWSYGGYMALMCAMKTDVFAAAVSGAPVTDWRLYDTHYTEHYMGDPREVPEAYDDASVLSYVRQLKTPLLVIHGMADDNVLFTHSTKLFELLQRKNVVFEMMTYPGEKHGLLRSPRAGVHGYAAIAAFFDRHLGPEKN